MTTVPFPVFAPTVDAFYQAGDADYTAAFTRGFAVSQRLYGTPGKTYVVNGVVLNGQQFDGRGCVVQDAVGAPYAFKLTGWQPMLRDIQFQAQGNVDKVTTNAGGFAAGATSINVASSTGFALRQMLLVQGNTNNWFTTQVTGVSGSTITLGSATPEVGSSGLTVVASAGLINLDDSEHARIEDILFVNTGVGITLTSTATENAHAKLSDLQFDAVRWCAIAKYGNAHDVTIDNFEAFCGVTDVFNYTGAGVAGSFNAVYFNDLIRDLVVTVNGVNQVYGVNWTFTSDYLITFLAGSYPANGAPVVLRHYHDSVRGFVEDQRGSTVSGGNQYSALRILKAFIGVELQGVTLSEFTDTVIDTVALIGVLMSNCGIDLNFVQLSVTWCRTCIAAYNCGNVQINGLVSDQIPAGYYNPFLPVTGPEISGDALSTLAIDLDAWWSAAYTVSNQPGVRLYGGKKTKFGSATALAAAATVYLGPMGQTNIGFPADIADVDGYAVLFYGAVNAAPGAGQTVTLSLIRNAQGAPTTLASIVITGAASYGGYVAFTPTAFAAGDQLHVQAVYSAGAASSTPRGFFVRR